MADDFVADFFAAVLVATLLAVFGATFVGTFETACDATGVVTLDAATPSETFAGATFLAAAFLVAAFLVAAFLVATFFAAVFTAVGAVLAALLATGAAAFLGDFLIGIWLIDH
ncbi:MAG: hypothetical protein ABJB74_22230 [Gemmatimonas sp.]